MNLGLLYCSVAHPTKPEMIFSCKHVMFCVYFDKIATKIFHKPPGSHLVVIVLLLTFVCEHSFTPVGQSRKYTGRIGTCANHWSLDFHSITGKIPTKQGSCEIEKKVEPAVLVKVSKMTSLAVVPYDESSLPVFHKAEREFIFDDISIKVKQDWQSAGVAAVVWDAVS